MKTQEPIYLPRLAQTSSSSSRSGPGCHTRCAAAPARLARATWPYSRTATQGVTPRRKLRVRGPGPPQGGKPAQNGVKMSLFTEFSSKIDVFGAPPPRSMKVSSRPIGRSLYKARAAENFEDSRPQKAIFYNQKRAASSGSI